MAGAAYSSPDEATTCSVAPPTGEIRAVDSCTRAVSRPSAVAPSATRWAEGVRPPTVR